MSVTGVWVVGAVPDDVVRAHARTSRPAARDEELPPELARALAWWAEGADKTCPVKDDPAALRFAELVDSASAAEDDEPTLTLQEELMHLMPQIEGEGPFAAAACSAGPVAALVYALGPAASAQLPGRFGEFLLTHDELAAALPGAERALDLSGARREHVLARAADWMGALGDPEFDAAELLDTPLRVLRHAARSGHGAAAFSRWY
ncbi:hypothetical protein ABZ479_02700 [Streptomyces sp. NPDC005722]